MLTKQPFWPHSDCVLYNSACGDMFLHSSVCVRLRDSGWQTHSVCGRLQCELQGQAVEGRAGDLSLRIELISLVSRRPLLPLLSLHAVLFWRWRAFLSVFACVHFSWCSWLCFVNVHQFYCTSGNIYTQKTFKFIFRYAKMWANLFPWASSANGAEVIIQIQRHFLCSSIFTYSTYT